MSVLPPGAFRLLLALAVVASHTSRLDIGRLAVLLFFYLSGYWISLIYDKDFKGLSGAFYLSRWLRIAPIYFIVMLPAANLRHLPIGWENLSIIGIASTGRDPTGVAWSLDIELQFYFIFPLLMSFASRPRLFLSVIAAMTGLGWLLKAQFGVATAMMYSPAFALGILNHTMRWKPSERTGLASLVTFTLGTVLLALMPFTAALLDKTKPQILDQDIFSMIWMLPLVPYVACSLTKKSSQLDRDMGNWSYPIYLVHYPLIALAVESGYSKWGGVALAIALGLALFYGPDRLFERGRRWLVGGALRLNRPTAVAFSGEGTK